MTAVGNVLKGVAGLAGGVLGSVLFGKKKAAEPVKTASPLPVATPRANSVLADTLAARRGAAANQRTGLGGVESSTTAKKQLLGQ